MSTPKVSREEILVLKKVSEFPDAVYAPTLIGMLCDQALEQMDAIAAKAQPATGLAEALREQLEAVANVYDDLDADELRATLRLRDAQVVKLDDELHRQRFGTSKPEPWQFIKLPLRLEVDGGNNEVVRDAKGESLLTFWNIGHEPEQTEVADRELDRFRALIVSAFNAAALSNAAPSGWRGMETLPNNWGKNWELFWMLVWHPKKGMEIIKYSHAHHYQRELGFTHFQPLPLPPTQETETP